MYKLRDPAATAYLQRKQAEGKSRKEALRCLKRHLARRVWKLLHTPPTTAAPAPTVPDAPKPTDRIEIVGVPSRMICLG